ncbi:MAG TPA: hypothetical protein PLB18_24500, partial [Acidobacteriota bacterium]|nr:hypothetical protein [Acidobacteriota bacterium]
MVLDKSNYNRDDLIEFDRIYAVAWDSATNGYGSIYIESNVRGTYPIRYPQGTNPTEFTLLLL